MTKKIILISFTLLVTIACHKNQIAAPANSFSVVIDGTTLPFKEINIDSTQSYVGISAAVDGSDTSPEISITIFRNGPLTVGTYPVLTPTSGSSQLNYYERTAGVLTEYQSPDDSVTITSVDGYFLTGTFHGTGDYALIDPNTFQVTLDPTRTRVMTNGKFSVKLH